MTDSVELRKGPFDKNKIRNDARVNLLLTYSFGMQNTFRSAFFRIAQEQLALKRLYHKVTMTNHFWLDKHKHIVLLSRVQVWNAQCRSVTLPHPQAHTGLHWPEFSNLKICQQCTVLNPPWTCTLPHQRADSQGLRGSLQTHLNWTNGSVSKGSKICNSVPSTIRESPTYSTFNIQFKHWMKAN